MTFRSGRRGSIPWPSILVFAAGLAVGAVVLVLVLGAPENGEPSGAPTSAPTTPSGQQALAQDTPTGAATSTDILAPATTPSSSTPTPSTGNSATPTVALSPTVPAASPTPEATPTPEAWTRERIEAAVRDAVERYQEAREYSQRTGDTSRLSEVLAGQALQRQTQLVQQYQNQNCYWEISLDEPMTYEFLQVRDDDWVQVRVSKVETRRYYCNDALRSTEARDAYSTVYVVERQEDGWYLTQRE